MGAARDSGEGAASTEVDAGDPVRTTGPDRTVGPGRTGRGDDPAAGDPHVGRIIVSEADLKRRVRELGEVITADYAGRPPLLVGVLKGACFFLSDLARAIDLPVEIDFMAVSSYGSSTHTSGVVRIVMDLDADLTDRHVLIVEDIVDSGLTLSFLRRNLAARNPASLEVCALLVKEGLQSVDLKLAYEGFHIPPEFVIGYGLDAGERYRNLPYLAVYHDPDTGAAETSLGRS